MKLKGHKILFVIVLIILSAVSSGFSQQYNFLKYTVADGLPHPQVLCSYQDKAGYMWIGTQGGLCRFDGTEFELFVDSSGALGNEVSAIAEGTDGIYIASERGVVFYKKGIFNPIKQSVGARFTKVYSFTWVSKMLILATDNGLFKVDGQQVIKVYTGSDIDKLVIRTVLFDSSNKLWVGTDRNGLFAFNYVNGVLIEDPISELQKLSQCKIRALIEISDGDVMVGTSGSGFYSFDGNIVNQVKLPNFLEVNYITSGVKDANGIAWFGTWGEGLVSYNNGVFRNYNRNNGLFDDVILTVSVDSRGNVWMGSLNSSLIMYYGDTFTRLTKDDGLPSNEVRGIVEDDDANIWMATLNGVAMYDGVDVKVFDEKDGIQYPRIGAICTDGKTIYAGAMDGVLIEIANEKVRTYRSEGGVEPGEIISLMYTNDNSVWIGTVRKGLFLFTNGKIQQVESGAALLNNPIWSLYEDANGVIWLGTEKGLYKMENGSAISPVVIGNKSILTEAIYDIDGDANYIYFASKSKGLGRFHLKNTKIEVLDKTEGLGSVYTEGVVRNGKNGFYVLTVLGLDEVILANDTQYVRHYYFREGIGTTKFSTGAAYLNEYGTLYMGSSDGVIIYRAPKKERVKFIKNIQIKSILLNNYEVNWSLFTDSISSAGIPFNLALPSNKNNLTFKIAGLEYGAGVQLQFQYRLLGRDSSWLSSNGSSIIALNKLDPGDYVLQVRALSTTNYGENQIEYYFSIQQPFWSTWWFFLCTVGVVVFVVLIVLNYYRRSKISFVEQHVTSYNFQVVVSRIMLLLGGTLYPFSGWLCSVFEESLNYQSSVQLLLGGTMIVTGILSYFVQYVKKHTQLFSHLLYSAIVAHTFYLCHINHLEPVLVITLMVLLSAAALILDNNKSAIIFVAAVLVSTFLLIILAGGNTGYNRYLLLLAAIIHLIIVFISVNSRYNMFNRLIFADITINNSRSLIIAANRYGKIIFASRSFESVLGYRDEDLLGDGWWKVRTKEEEENKRMLDKVLQATSTSATYVAAIIARDGTKKYIQWVDTEIIDGIKVGIGQDVTDRYELEARYQHIVEAATDIIYTTDYKGRFTFLNEVATKISCYKMEDLIGKHFSDIIHPSWKAEVIGHYLKQFERKQVNTYLEFVMIGAEGQKIWIGQTVRLLLDNSKPGGISGFQAIARDITEKKNYEEELEKLSLVASETINGVLICDPDGLIEWVNEGFTRITGFELQEVKGRLPGDVMVGERTDKDVIRKVRNLSSSAEGFHEEFLVYHKDGHEIWIDVSNTPIVDERGDILKQIEIFTDTTEKKRIQMQLNAYSVRLETLNMAKQQLLHSYTIQDIASNVLGALVQRLPDLRRASLALLDEHTETIRIQYVLKDAEYDSSSVEVPYEAFGSLPALLKNNYVIEGNLPGKADKSQFDEENVSVGIKSYLMMPLFSQNKLLGSINFESGIVNGITGEMVDMVREVADAMAAAVTQINYLNIIEQKNENIQSSILYARRIQNAILPPEEYLKERFGDIFVLYQPKDVLSGDFYWVERRDKYTYLAVVDSTGHGVPGSLLSLMGYNLLNQAIHERGLIRPAAILDYLNIGIQHTLNQYKGAGELRDGMDVALCVFEDGANVVQFAGAINPLYVVRDGMLIQCKGNRFSIGSYFDNKFRPFTNQESDLQSGDILYMFSDGYADQFGGDSDRKISQRVFREILLDIHHLPLADQKEELLRRLSEWQKNAPQTDDICIIGIKI